MFCVYKEMEKYEHYSNNITVDTSKYSETSIHHSSMYLFPHIPHISSGPYKQRIITLDTVFLSVLFCSVRLSQSEGNVIFLEYTAVQM
jgi:hypothetical protein